MADSFAEFLVRLQARDDAAARELLARFAGQLIALARRRFGDNLRHKVDPEDVVQSAYKSFFVRYGGGDLEADGWNGLWGLLVVITARKCAERVAYHYAGRRNVAREAATPRADDSTRLPEPAGREPAPDEAVVLQEAVDRLFAAMDEDERPVLELSLQGYSTREISERLGRAERTVRLLRECVRHRLERMREESL